MDINAALLTIPPGTQAHRARKSKERIVVAPMPDNLIPQARVTIIKHYDGPVACAKDLDNY
jgi:hypothetical protein